MNESEITENQQSQSAIEKVPSSRLRSIFKDMMNGRFYSLFERIRINNIAFIIVIAFLTGLYELTSLSILYYQKDHLKLEPQTIQLLMGLVLVPWTIKPVFGYISDSIIKKIKKTKKVVIVTSLLRILVFVILTCSKPHTVFFFILLFVFSLCALFENIVSEYVLVKDTNQKNNEDDTKTHNQLPIYFGFRAFGSLLGSFFGGRLIKIKGNQFPYFISSFFPLLSLIAVILFKEKPIDINRIPRRSVKEEFKLLKRMLFRKKVILFILIICLINLTPNFDTLVNFYMIDKLLFTSEDLANFRAFAKVCFIFGLLLYYFCLKGVNPRRFYVASNFVLWIFNMSFLFVVLGIVAKLGMNPKVFCLLTNGAFTFFAELNFMPILAICCGLCPENLEATSIALFTSIMNLSEGLSYYIGSFIMWLTNIHKSDYNQFWKLIVLQNSYLLIMIIFVAFIPFPDPSKERITVEEVGMPNSEIAEEKLKDDEITNEEITDVELTALGSFDSTHK